jgi:hypothetical protein
MTDEKCSYIQSFPVNLTGSQTEKQKNIESFNIDILKMSVNSLLHS